MEGFRSWVARAESALEKAEKAVKRWFTPPYWRETPAYQRRKESLRAEFPFPEDEGKTATFVLEQARYNYEAVERGMLRNEDKLLEMVKLSGIIASVLVAGVRAQVFANSGWLKAAIVGCVASMCVSIWGRHAPWRPYGTDDLNLLRHAIEGAQAVTLRSTKGFSRGTVGLSGLTEWRANMLHTSAWILAASLTLASIAIFIA